MINMDDCQEQIFRPKYIQYGIKSPLNDVNEILEDSNHLQGII